MPDEASGISPHPERKVAGATLLLGDLEIPVTVALRTVTNARDGRACWEGDLWSDRMPHRNLDGRLTLRLTGGLKAQIRLTKCSWSEPIDADGGGLFRGEFLSENNYKE